MERRHNIEVDQKAVLKLRPMDKHCERKPVFSTEPYTDEELDKLRQAFLTSDSYAHNAAADFHRWRDATIVMTASILGLRPGEALALRWDMINWDGSEIYIDPYSNKQRTTTPVVLTQKAKNVLLAWHELSNKSIHCPWVFPSLQTFEPITTSGYAKRLRQISIQAGIYKIVWYTEAGQPIGNKRFYSARKHFGTKVYHHSKDPYLVKRALRHTRLSSGEPYIYADKEQIKTDLDAVFK